MPISLSGSLIITGSITVQSITGSISGSLIGNANSASFAQTASSADNFVVRQGLTGSNALFTGAITAQTLVVQTVTSSVVYSSGSNRFGNQLTDVQQMTGSVRITGSLSVNGTSVPTGTGTQNYVTKWNNAAGTTIGDSSIQDNTLNVLVSKNSAVNDIGISILQSANGTATYLQLAGTNDAGSRYNFIHSVTNGGSEHWRIGGAGSPENVSFYTGGTEKMRITGSNVGIGTTSPGYKLDVNGTTRSTTFLSEGATGTTGLSITSNTTSGNGSVIRVNKVATSNQAYMSFESDQLYLGVSSNDSGSGYVGAKTGVNLALQTAYTTRLFISASGDVGIGTATPLLRCHILGSTSAFPSTSGTTQTGGVLRLQNSDSNGILDIGGNGGSGFWLQTTNATTFAANYSLLLNPNGGSVGIGTTSPSSKLDVNGDANISGSITTNGFILKGDPADANYNTRTRIIQDTFTISNAAAVNFDVDTLVSNALFTIEVSAMSYTGGTSYWEHGIGRGYLFPSGFGISYTSLSNSGLSVALSYQNNTTVRVALTDTVSSTSKSAVIRITVTAGYI